MYLLEKLQLSPWIVDEMRKIQQKCLSRAVQSVCSQHESLLLSSHHCDYCERYDCNNVMHNVRMALWSGRKQPARWLSLCLGEPVGDSADSAKMLSKLRLNWFNAKWRDGGSFFSCSYWLWRKALSTSLWVAFCPKLGAPPTCWPFLYHYNNVDAVSRWKFFVCECTLMCGYVAWISGSVAAL